MTVDDIIERLSSPERLDHILADWALLSDEEQEAGGAFIDSYYKLHVVLTDLVIQKVQELPDNVVLLPSFVDKVVRDLEPRARALYRKQAS